ncbi:uncharacterized protein LOC132186674 [Corylus avellana]|uniref:uncharacterized protein LOC132186674 n=1 Tax=Corylus avellana TaxID=13451 RepID=UPI00286CB470|nr:uncharacterized protein LOC132186674 [Corylus avellana]
MATTRVSLKLFIDKKRQRVLFAEADKEFVDFLFSIFTLPVGAVTRLLKEGGGMVGCLPTLYRSIENMSVSYIQPDKDKRFLLEPNVVMPGAKLPLLLPNVSSTFRQLYRCPYSYISSNCSSYVADDDSTICPQCNNKMDRTVTFIDPPRTIRASPTSEEGYVKPMVTYMVMDDMEVKPSSSSILVTLLTKFNVKDVGDVEEKVVDLGMDEGVKLLKASLQSNAVLTDVFLSLEHDKGTKGFHVI